MRRWLWLSAGLALALSVFRGVSESGPQRAVALDATEVVVTSAGDGDAAASDCPDEAKCTLRAAILYVNAGAAPDGYAIRFSEAVFASDTPVPIAVANAPLPPVTQPGVHIDARGTSVLLDGALLAGEHDGLVLLGSAAHVSGLSVTSFSGSCISVFGTGATIEDNVVANCVTGISLRGAESSARRNEIGFDGTGAAGAVSTGIRVVAANITVGGSTDTPGDGNLIGNAATAIAVGEGTSGSSFTGTSVGWNVIGRSPAGANAPVAIGVQILPPSSFASVRNNTISGTTIAGIQVVTGAAEPGVVGNRLAGNSFDLGAGMAIDLAANGLRDANDAGDEDSGPNLLQNHPEFIRPAQSAISGRVPGCEGCSVELYRAHHSPGGESDYGREPIEVAPAITDAAGNFSFVAPPVVPGTWVTAIATDVNGNSSEFGPSARVGGGAAQCGNLVLRAGWNQVGYFFPTPLTLGTAFPPNSGTVRAIYRLDDGSGTYSQWIEGTTVGRTLTTLNPGEAYWFYTDAETTLASGFALAVPVPVELQAGWNSFVYIGGDGDIRDAFASIAGQYSAVYRYVNDGETEGWEQYAGPNVPGWVHDFTMAEACTAYTVFMEEPATLIPLQP